jgi:hypothetical protein
VVQEVLEYSWDAPDPVDVLHVVFSRRPRDEVRQSGYR